MLCTHFAYAHAGLSLCWSHITHCQKSYVVVHIYVFSDFCPTLIDLESGSVLVLSDGQTTTAEVFCMKGYKLIGSANLTCQVHGDWNVDVPYCGKSIMLSTCMTSVMSFVFLYQWA